VLVSGNLTFASQKQDVFPFFSKTDELVFFFEIEIRGEMDEIFW